jgi:hypothetical protein
MRVAIGDGPENECRQVTVTCTVGSSGRIPLAGEPLVDTNAGDKLVLIVDETHRSITGDNPVTIRLERMDGTVEQREINLTELFRLVRGHVSELPDLPQE